LGRGKSPRIAATLQRTTFETSRLLEFFTEKELTMQIGHRRAVWPLALLKELLDNALDACETAGITPQILVTVESDRLTVEDNGPGLPAATLERSLDYLVRVSDKAHYVSPTRGQLGNALKCLWAAPYVVDGEHGHVEVWSHGQHHTIDVHLDRIAQAPQLAHAVEAGLVKSGTRLALHWAGIASCLDGTADSAFYKPTHEIGSAYALLRAYAMCNPHAAFRLHDAEGVEDWTATDPGWRKWQPSDPTAPHWYTVEHLRALIAAYLAVERDGGQARTVREFIAEFRGLSGSGKQQAVAAAAGLSGARLHDLVHDGDVDVARVGRLLGAMQTAARPVPPLALGVLGEEHLRTHLVDACLVAPDSIRYKRVVDVDHRGIPFVLEVAFGIYDETVEGCQQTVIAGINWAPTIALPFRELPHLLGEAHAARRDPVVLAMHFACPRVEFLDRGKGVLADAS
jgi:DNA topoisomerase VI subunit B